MKQFIIRVLALTVVFSILNQALLPTISYALTSMQTQPEVYGYQPVDATDHVNLANGKFNYTVPITSIPEFPMAIGYSSGPTVDQESSFFGYGFNGFSGAISRNMMGLPDDVAGAEKKYIYSNQMRWDASLSGTLSLDKYSKSFGSSGQFELGANVSLTFGYCNYTGCYGAIGIGGGLQYKLKGKPSSKNPFLKATPSLSASLVSDSRESGLGYGISSGISVRANLKNDFCRSAAPSLGAGISFSGVMGKRVSAKKNIHSYCDLTLGKSIFDGASSNSSTSLPPLHNVVAGSSGFGVSLTYPVNPSLSVTGAYSQNITGDDEISLQSYGFMYLNEYSRGNHRQLADFTVEGESSYSDSVKLKNSPTYLQRDFFSVNTQGLSGSMQLYQKEYGVVSRKYAKEQYIDIGLLSITTNRREVYPWMNVAQAVSRKGIDILSLIKKKDKPEERGFDKTLFDEKEQRSLNTEKHNFSINQKPQFKMRGDYAGEFNMASNNFKDHDIVKYDLIHIPTTATGGGVSALLYDEKIMPLYAPQVAAADDYHEAGAELDRDRGTHITYTSVGELIDAYNEAKGGIFTPPAISDNMAQSYYNHYSAVNSDMLKSRANTLNFNNNENENFNILAHLKSLRQSTQGGEYFNKLIGSVEIKATSGLRYIFNLPVFNKSSKSVQLQGKGIQHPEINQDEDDYHSFDGKDRGKLTTEDKFMYPYAWMLTAIVGDNYIDFDNIPGPSDGDIGYWVKFKYVKVADNYRWRAPFMGMNHSAGAMHDFTDDMYSASSGTKEIYYLAQIESSNYICNYQLSKRFDGFDAKSFANGEGRNSYAEAELPVSNQYIGKNAQYLVSQIDLYTKHGYANNGTPRYTNTPYRHPIKSTKFEYDYSSSAMIANNTMSDQNGMDGSALTVADVPYHYNYSSTNTSLIGTGKATLRKVQPIAYNQDGKAMNLPSYEFNYNQANNPDYDAEQLDQWGNYYKNSKYSNGAGVNFYTNYTALTKTEADENAKALNLSQVLLPSGGSLDVSYEAQSYSYVQEKKPYVMRQIKNAVGIGEKDIKVSVDITDLNQDEDGNRLTTLQGLNETKLLKPGDVVYGEIAFYQIPNAQDEKYLFVSSGEAKVKSLGTIEISGDKVYQEVVLNDKKETEYKKMKMPFISDCETFMYGESLQMRVLKEVGGTACGAFQALGDRYASMQNDNPIDAVRKMITNVVNALVPNLLYRARFDDCYGHPGTAIFSHLSYLRTPVYKAKYTGSSVKTLTMNDGFRYATQANGSYGVDENSYGTRYYYDVNSDGTGRSAGVATIEPGGGKSCIIDNLDLKGVGFLPSPGITSSRTSYETVYGDLPKQKQVGDDISRYKGKSVYEFYTSLDNELRATNQFKEGPLVPSPGNPHGRFFLFGLISYLSIKFKIFTKRFEIRLPFILPLTVRWNRHDNYYLKSYAYTDYTDMVGKPKSIIQLDGSGKEIGNQKFTYYGLDEPVNVYNGSYNQTSTVKKPGKIDQAWSEAYYTKESKISFIPWILFLNAETDRNFSYTSMKYSYVPSILKSTTTTVDGATTTSTNSGFDFYTGSPIETRTNDSYANVQIKRDVPAYWKYPQMGPSAIEARNVNNLTPTTGSYLYLNTVNPNQLLSASVVEWAKNDSTSGWAILDYLQPKKEYQSSVSYGYHNYSYLPIKGKAIEAAYDSYTPTGQLTKLYVKNNGSLYKPYRNYVYEVPITDSGTFVAGGFTDFDYTTGQNNLAKWRNAQTTTMYSQNGEVIETQDILGNYTSTLLGYNFSNKIAEVSNGSWGASAYDGAENTYNHRLTSSTMLENNKISLLNATIAQSCNSQYANMVLSMNDLRANPNATLQILIDHKGAPVYNTPLAKFNATFYTNVNRTLYLSLADDGHYQLISNDGESFDGFFEYDFSASAGPISAQRKALWLRNSDFTSITVDPNFKGNSTYGVSLKTREALPSCSLNDKAYKMPTTDCIGEAHTGNYFFKLNQYAKGTQFTISAQSAGYEFNRKYKALVWVHNSSPGLTKLVAQQVNAQGTLVNEQSVSLMDDAYVRAGKWVLLRLDLNLMDIPTTNKVNVFVQNQAGDGISSYDDFRVLPYHADMTNTVYDHLFNYPLSTLDKDHFATFSMFDERGRVKESSVEIENVGKKLVKKLLYNDQKHN